MGKNKRLPNDTVLAALQLVRGQDRRKAEYKEKVRVPPFRPLRSQHRAALDFVGAGQRLGDGSVRMACADGYAAKVLGRPFEIGAGLRDRKLI